MSQSGSYSIAQGMGFVETLTGNSGGAVGPNGSDNINVVGDKATINVVGDPGSNTLTISSTGNSILNYKSINHAASPYTVLSTDNFLGCQTSTGTITINLPNATSTGAVYVIKDSNGAAAASNITVTTVGGAVTIDGSTSYIMNLNYQAIQVLFDGTSYEIF